MKSNQERSNECLPPKKRELASSTLPSDEQRPLATPPASDGQRGQNLAWFASVASGHDAAHSMGGAGGGQQRAGVPDGPQYKPLVSSLTDSSFTSRSAISSLSAIYTSPLSHHAVGGGGRGGGGGGTIHYAQLPPSLQFVPSPYVPAGPAPYAGYISSQLLPPPPPPPPLSAASQRPPRSEALPYPSPAAALASKMDQHRPPSGRPAPPPPDLGAAQQYVQVSGSPLGAAAPQTALSPLPPPSHHHTLALGGGAQVLVQYSDGPPGKDEGPPRPREVLNGELDRGGRRFESGQGKPGSKGSSTSSSSLHFHQQQSPHHYEARHVVLPTDYASQDPPALRTHSLMLVPNSHAIGGDHHHPYHHHHHHHHHSGGSPDKLPASSLHSEKGGIVLGKPVARPPSSSSATSSSSFVFPPPLSVESLKAAVATLPPHTVIQTPHSATEPLSLGLPSANFYPQPPIIGYIAGGGGQQQPISYHAGLPQHLLIPGAQSVIIPVSGGGVTSLDAAAVTSSHAYFTAAANPAPKGEHFDPLTPTFAHPAVTGAVVQAQLHLPVVPAPPGLLAAPPAAPPSLPPYFVKGSIIQLADGELKRVEDLKTEDFIQSAEISSELKIDSSTVERIDGSHTPNFAVVQFSVGEHRAQVSVEVLAEYPFFVFGQGWSSCCPDRTTQLLELPCAKLAVGDVCISLTLRNLKNGSLKKTQALELNAQASAASSPNHGHLKPPRAGAGAPRGGGGGGGGSARHGEQENGVSQHAPLGGGSGGGTPSNSENGEARVREVGGAEAGARPGRRKRRWSAPEGRKVERTEEEPPLTLPKPSFLPQEVKISMEGHSNIGK